MKIIACIDNTFIHTFITELEVLDRAVCESERSLSSGACGNFDRMENTFQTEIEREHLDLYTVVN